MRYIPPEGLAMTALESPPRSSGLSEEDISLARASALMLHANRDLPSETLKLQLNGVAVLLPGSLATILGECLDLMAEGRGVAVLPVDDEIGTQEAADALGVSRPYLVKLLDSHAIPSRKVGVQRRVRIVDVRAYKDREKAARRKVLAELAAEGQRLKLGE